MKTPLIITLSFILWLSIALGIAIVATQPTTAMEHSQDRLDPFYQQTANTNN